MYELIFFAITEDSSSEKNCEDEDQSAGNVVIT